MKRKTMKNLSLWIFALVTLAICLPVHAAEDLFSSPPKNIKRLAIDSKHCISAERHLWVRGGQITVNPSLTDVFDIKRFHSAPFSGTNRLTVLIDGKPVVLKSYEWRPSEVLRSGRSGNLQVETLLTPAVDQRGFLLTARLTNQGDKEVTVPIRLAFQGNLNQTQVWRFSPPKSKIHLAQAKAPKDKQSDRILLKNNQGHVALVTDLPDAEAKKDKKETILAGELKLSPGKSAEFHLAIAVGENGGKAMKVAEAILAKPTETIVSSRQYWSDQIEKLYKHFPRITSDNQKLVDFYDRGLLDLPLARWEMPGFVLSPHYSTAGIDGGALCCYIWDFAYGSRMNPLYDPEAVRAHLTQHLKSKPMEHYAFSPLDGTPIGPHYSYNQYSIIRIIYYYVTMTGDVAFLDKKVDGKTILEHVIAHATYGDDPSKPVALIDYGNNKNLLELKRTKNYEGYVPSPNAERCWSYQAADELSALAKKPSPKLSKRADALAKLLVEELWSDSDGWFLTRDKEGKPHLCYSIQIFDLLRFDILDEAKQKAILGHLNDKEFLSKYGVHSLSKKDPGYDPKDVDWGGPGIYTGDAPELICDLYESGHPKEAGDLLRRILWWSQVLPYYPQAIHADRIEYRKNGRANLQNGAMVAEALIFGVLGLNVTTDGTVSIRPYLPPDTKSLEFKNVRIHDLKFDVSITPDGFKVIKPDGTTISGNLGQKSIIQK